jgi:hypothetical protein
VIQSLLLAVGFFAIGLPAAGLWTVVVLLLCIVQVQSPWVYSVMAVTMLIDVYLLYIFFAGQEAA